MVCKNCGEQNAPGEINCRKCGAALSVSVQTIKCSACKTENAASEKFCIKCGTLLVTVGRPPAPPEPKKPAYMYRTTVRQRDPITPAAQPQQRADVPVARVQTVQPEMTVRTEPVTAPPAVAETPRVQTERRPAVPVEELPPVQNTREEKEQLRSLSSLFAGKNGVTCSFCGTVHTKKEEFCIACGEPLVSERKKTQKQKTEGRSAQQSGKQVPLVSLVLKKIFGNKKNAAPAKGTAKKSGKKPVLDPRILIIAACCIALFALGALFGSLRSDTKGLVYDAVDYNLQYALGSGTLHLYADGSEVDSEPAIAEPTSVYYDLHNSCGVFSMPIQENGVATNSVYYFNKQGITRIINSVNNVISFSAQGTAVLYVDANAALSLYTVKNGKTVVLAENGAYVSGAYALSPDGEYAMYCYRNEAGTNSVCVWHDGNRRDVCSSGVPIAVANEGKSVYYLTVLNNTYDFYLTTYKKPAKFTKIATGIYANALKFNSDLSEVLFTLLDGGTYYSKAGKQAKRVSSSSMYPILCNTVNYKSCSGLATVYGMEEFFDNFWIGESGLYYIEQGEDPVMVVAGVRSYDISDDGNKLAYADAEGKLFVKDRKSALENTASFAENVTAVAVTGDAEDVYYLNSVNALCSLDKNGNSTLVAQEIDGIMCSESGVYYKGVSPSEIYRLYYCSNGKSGKEIADSVKDFQIFDGCAYYTSGDGQHMYYSKNGNRSFKQLF